MMVNLNNSNRNANANNELQLNSEKYLPQAHFKDKDQ